MTIDKILFLTRFVSNPSGIGSFFPSSKQLALGLIKEVRRGKADRAMRYLEIGAGSGALTKTIIEKLRPEDHLVIVERDPTFCHLLRKKFGEIPNVTIHELSILDFSETSFDCVISSLPLNAFSADFVEQVLHKFETLVAEGGILSYFEYRWLGYIKKTLLFGSALRDFQKNSILKKSFLGKYCFEVDAVWWNMPPTKIFHCKM